MAQDNSQKIIEQHQRRLNILRERLAKQGINADPSVQIEIEDIEQELARLQGKSHPASVEQSSANQTSGGRQLRVDSIKFFGCVVQGIYISVASFVGLIIIYYGSMAFSDYQAVSAARATAAAIKTATAYANDGRLLLSTATPTATNDPHLDQQRLIELTQQAELGDDEFGLIFVNCSIVAFDIFVRQPGLDSSMIEVPASEGGTCIIAAETDSGIVVLSSSVEFSVDVGISPNTDVELRILLADMWSRFQPFTQEPFNSGQIAYLAITASKSGLPDYLTYGPIEDIKLNLDTFLDTDAATITPTPTDTSTATVTPTPTN